MKNEKCQDCPYLDKKYVPAVGPIDAEVVIVGEAPGATEENKGIPFVGGAGRVLDMLLANADIKRHRCYITNVLKCRPPGNNIKGKDAIKAVEICTERLAKELLELHNTRVIVPTGNIPLNALGIQHKITSIRGTVMSTSWGKVIPTYHPAYIMRQWHEFVTGVYDWRKIKRHMEMIGYVEHGEDFRLSPTIDQVEAFVHEIEKRAQNERVDLALDLETFITGHPMKTPIKLCGIATDASTAMVIPFITQGGGKYWSTADEAVRATTAIGRLLENPNITVLVHNGLFDILVLMNHGFRINCKIYDSMLGHFLVYHLTSHSLAYLVSIYLDYQAWKLDKGTDDEAYRRYNARDCVVLQMIKPHLDEDIDSNGVRWVFDNLMKVIVPTCKMTLNGIHIEPDALKEVQDSMTTDMHKLETTLQTMCGKLDFNPRSTAQLRQVLFEDMKLRSGVKTPSGAKSTGDDVLKKLSLRYPDDKFVDTLRDYRKVQKRMSTYGNPPILDDGRVHSQFKLTVITGRYGSQNPNVQNLPTAKTDPQGYIRGMYAAPFGSVLVEADYSQAELIIFAVLSNDQEWLTAFEEGKDIHKLNGDALIGKYEKKYRTFFKNFIYGFLYGSQGGEIEKVAPKELIERLSVEEMIANFQRRHPGMFAYRKQCEEALRKRHRITNPFGRTRFYVNNISKKDLRESFNFPVTSTVADMMHEKMALLDREFDLQQDKMILQLHDAFYLEVKDNRKTFVAQALKDIMEAPVFAPNGMRFQLNVSVEMGPNMSKMAEVEL